MAAAVAAAAAQLHTGWARPAGGCGARTRCANLRFDGSRQATVCELQPSARSMAASHDHALPATPSAEDRQITAAIAASKDSLAQQGQQLVDNGRQFSQAVEASQRSAAPAVGGGDGGDSAAVATPAPTENVAAELSRTPSSQERLRLRLTHLQCLVTADPGAPGLAAKIARVRLRIAVYSAAAPPPSDLACGRDGAGAGPAAGSVAAARGGPATGGHDLVVDQLRVAAEQERWGQVAAKAAEEEEDGRAARLQLLACWLEGLPADRRPAARKLAERLRVWLSGCGPWLSIAGFAVQRELEAEPVEKIHRIWLQAELVVIEKVPDCGSAGSNAGSSTEGVPSMYESSDSGSSGYTDALELTTQLIQAHATALMASAVIVEEELDGICGAGEPCAESAAVGARAAGKALLVRDVGGKLMNGAVQITEQVCLSH